MVCVERTPSPLLVYSSRVVPGQVKDGNMCNRLPKDKSDLPAKLHLDKKQATVSRPLGSIDPLVGPLGTTFGQVHARWSLISSSGCLPPLYVGLACQVDPSCKCDAGRDLLCSLFTSSSCFCLIPNLHPKIVKYANISVKLG